jgi:hypothetical protein
LSTTCAESARRRLTTLTSMIISRHCRPRSRRKRWRSLNRELLVVVRNQGRQVLPQCYQTGFEEVFVLIPSLNK